MIKPFKFFKGYVYSDEYTFQDTPEGHMNRRYSFHTNQVEHERRALYSELYDRESRPYRESVERYIDLNDQRIFFPKTSVTKVNPKWWMKIKIFFQEMKIKIYIQDNEDMFGVIFFAAAVTICFGLIIGKILNVW
jgi:hypothetical protein